MAAQHRKAFSTCTLDGTAGQAGSDLWVFAYGSLMWRPDFPHVEATGARLWGWHRAMCILSNRYRGTEVCPGLVLGLDRGGSCRGRAFRVEAHRAAEVRRILDEREMFAGVYAPRFLPACLKDGRRVAAWAYIVRRDHAQYRPFHPEQAIALIRQGIGEAGTARDYLAATVAELAAMGAPDRTLERLLRQVDAHPPGDAKA